MLHADRWYRLQYGNMIENWFVPLSLGACALLAVAILWKVPQWQVGRVKDLAPKERFDRVNEARKTLATILGGIVLLVGGFFTYQNLNLAREGQITDRFSKAIEQLGAVDTSGKKKLEVRLGGIYALERIANESERDHWPIMEVLCTYVRENAPRKPQESARENQASAPATRPPADIQAILTVLGRRNTKYDSKEQIFVLSQTDLRYVRFFELNLRWAFFTRRTSTVRTLKKRTSARRTSETQTSATQTSATRTSARRTSEARISETRTSEMLATSLKNKSMQQREIAERSYRRTCTCPRAGSKSRVPLRTGIMVGDGCESLGHPASAV